MFSVLFSLSEILTAQSTAEQIIYDARNTPRKPLRRAKIKLQMKRALII